MDNILHNSFIFSNFTVADRVDLQPTRQGYPDIPSAIVKHCRGNILIRDNMKRLSFEELPEVNSERWLSLNDFEGEVWKNINGFGGNYSISNYGRVKSHARMRHTGKGGYYLTTEHIMRLSLHKEKGGYWYVSIHDKSKQPSHKIFVHRLVAEQFVLNKNNERYVNHKDENSRNNISNNLEWCSIGYNNAYGTAQSRAQLTRSKKGISKTVGMYNNGELVCIFQSLGDAARNIGIKKGTLSYYCRNEIEYKDGNLYKYL